jgi:O-antigen ligase
MIASRRRAERVVAAAAAGAGVIALALTGSRGGASGFVVSMLAFVFVGVRRGWIRPRAVVVGTAVLLVALIPVSGVLLARTESDAGAAESRQPLNQLALQTIEKNPLLGVGANNVGPEFQRTAGPEYSRDWIYTVHNKYLLVAAEAGVAALVAFLAFLVSTLRRGRRAVVGHGLGMSAAAAGLTCGVVAQMVHMTVDLFQSRPQVQLLWLIAAMLVVMSEQQRQQGRQHRRTELVA